ncbi:MAG: hypothetical protein AB7F89_03595 [Pirellulaceae bacterium]
MRRLMSRLLLLALCCLPTALWGAGPESIPSDFAQAIATRLVAEIAKIDQPQVKVDPAASQANGVHVPRKMGALIVPQKDLQESAELAAKFQQPPGAALGVLFLYNVVPVAQGQKLDASRLRSVTIRDEQGKEHAGHALLLAVRQPAADDYRLHGYGAGTEPVLEAKFSTGTTTVSGPLVLEVKDAQEATREGTVVLTVFGKYQATFRAAYTGD